MKPPLFRVVPRAALAACALALAACADRQPVATDGPGRPAQPLLSAALQCTASVQQRTVACVRTGLPGGARGYIVVGGQNQYVQLVSSNVTYDGTQNFAFDVTVKNLIPQPMGTTDGVTVDSDGVRVFFASGPTVTVGSGNVSVANADGIDVFTAGNQRYFRYGDGDLGADSILSSGETSSARNWQLNLDNTVTTFVFTLLVVAEVPKPQGYVDVYGGGTLLSGSSAQLVDSVRSAVGAHLPGALVTWTTADSAVATVDNTGNVTGVGAGSTTITATSGTRTGTATVTVCPNLVVGQVYTLAPGMASVCLGGYGATSEFTFMPVNLSQSSSLASFTVTGTGIQAVTGPPTPVRLPDGGLSLGQTGHGLESASDLPILEQGRADAARLMGRPGALIRGGRRAAPAGMRSIITPNVVPSVGDPMDLNTTTSCNGAPAVRRGVVRSVSQHLIIVADTANPPGGFTTAQYDSIALEFDTIAWPVDTANFGAPTDLDGNGHVVAFFTRAVNELSPPASSAIVLGFWAGKDMFSSAPASCPNSNEGEMFYMLVPDPTGVVNSNVRTVSQVRGNTTGTLGHELQHLISGFRRTYDPGGQKPLEEGFLNEGLSHVAEELMFYRTSVGLAPRGNIVVTQLTTGPNATRRVAAFNTYANPNFGRFRAWLQRPDTTGAFKQNANSLAVRGAIWAFLRYASDRVNGSEPAFWYSLVNSGLTGTANVQAAIGGADPASWLRDFTVAMYADDNAFTVDPVYRTPSWHYRSIYTALNSSYQLGPRPLTNATPLTLSYSAGGGAAYARFGVAASSFATVVASGPGGVLPATPYAVVVVRTK